MLSSSNFKILTDYYISKINTSRGYSRLPPLEANSAVDSDTIRPPSVDQPYYAHNFLAIQDHAMLIFVTIPGALRYIYYDTGPSALYRDFWPTYMWAYDVWSLFSSFNATKRAIDDGDLELYSGSIPSEMVVNVKEAPPGVDYIREYMLQKKHPDLESYPYDGPPHRGDLIEAGKMAEGFRVCRNNISELAGCLGVLTDNYYLPTNQAEFYGKCTGAGTSGGCGPFQYCGGAKIFSSQGAGETFQCNGKTPVRDETFVLNSLGGPVLRTLGITSTSDIIKYVRFEFITEIRVRHYREAIQYIPVGEGSNVRGQVEEVEEDFVVLNRRSSTDLGGISGREGGGWNLRIEGQKIDGLIDTALGKVGEVKCAPPAGWNLYRYDDWRSALYVKIMVLAGLEKEYQNVSG